MPLPCPSEAAPDDAVMEMLFRQGLFQQPLSIDDPAASASCDEMGRRALLVARIEGLPRQPVRLVWYATGTASLSPYADVAEAFARHASLALGAVMERDHLNRAVTARHRVGLAQGILMTRRQLTADQAFALLKRESQNTHVKLRAIAQIVIQNGDLPVGTARKPDDSGNSRSTRRGPQAPSFRFVPPRGRVATARRENAFLPPDAAPTSGSGRGARPSHDD